MYDIFNNSHHVNIKSRVFAEHVQYDPNMDYNTEILLSETNLSKRSFLETAEINNEKQAITE